MTHRILTQSTVLFFLFSFFLFVSCNQEIKPVTQEEAIEFGKQVEISIGKRSSDFMDGAMDAKELMKRASIKPGKNEKDFKEGMSQGMKMGTAIVNALSPKGNYEVVRHYEKNQTRHVLFRLYDQGMINYHDAELSRQGGKVKIADIFIYLNGQHLSETVHSLYLQMADEINMSKGPSEETSRWLKKMPEIRGLINAGRHQEANDIFNEIPAKIKVGRPFQILNVEIASGLGDELYRQAIEGYEKSFPNEPNTQLLLLDAYVLRKEYDKALKAVNQLDEAVGHDPVLDYHRSLCYTLLGKTDSSRACLERLVKNKPDFEDAIIELVGTYLDWREFEKAKPLIDRFQNRSEFDQSAMDHVLMIHPGYEAKYGKK